MKLTWEREKKKEGESREREIGNTDDSQEWNRYMIAKIGKDFMEVDFYAFSSGNWPKKRWPLVTGLKNQKPDYR